MEPLGILIDELASRQHGSLLTRQLTLAGATRDAIRHQLAVRRVVRGPHPGTLHHAAFPVTWEARLWAAQLWGGDACVLSHQAAGALYELDGCPPGHVALAAPKGTRNRHRSVDLHETTRPMPPWRVLRGLRVAAPEVTVVDLAAVLSEAAADDALHSALRRRLTSVDRIEPLLDGRPGTAAMRRLLAGVTGRPRDSRLEGEFVRRAKAAGIDLVAQHEVWVDGRRFRLDFADPVRRVAIELDGYETHGTRAAFQGDRTRDALLQLAGWRVLRFTWADVRERPEWVLACVRRALAA